MIIKFNEIKKNSSNFINNKPFPHIVLDNIFDYEFLSLIENEIKNIQEWDENKNFHGSINKRIMNTYENFPPNVKKLINKLNNKDMLEALERLTGEKNLIPDPYYFGGGIHSTTRGGFLKIHADFNWHKKLKLFRRINLLLYLTKEWKEEYNGNIEFWKKPFNKADKSIFPKFGRMVIFTTDDNSFHGHPKPLQCPENIWRNSIALYYYSSTRPSKNFFINRLGTDYVPVHNDNFKRVGILRKIWGSIKYKLFPNKF
tara:strand:- start:116 stop:886 length:771 start_codon:yes stop_codon:yes gene_type:complete